MELHQFYPRQHFKGGTTMGKLGNIRLEQFINHAQSKVWVALTTPENLAKWWAPGDIKPVIGHHFQLNMGPSFGPQSCKVIAVDEQQMFSYSFSEGFLNTTITWKLMSDKNGTMLTLEHNGFDLDSPQGKAAYAGMSAGWPKLLQRIETVITELQ